MLTLDIALSFFGVAIVLGLTPGPDNIFVLTQSAVSGRLAGMRVVLGLCTGLIVHTVAVAAGVAALFRASPTAFTALKLIGALYLLYLAWQSFRASDGGVADGVEHTIGTRDAAAGAGLRDGDGAVMDAVADARVGVCGGAGAVADDNTDSKPAEDTVAASTPGTATNALKPYVLFRRGVIMNLTNPKVSLFFLAFLPQFTSPVRGSVALQTLTLGALFMLATLLVFGVIAYFAGMIGERLRRSPQIQKMMNRVAGVIFVGLAVGLVLGGYQITS